MDENPNFVDLNRRFRILDPHRDSEESALDSYVAANLGIRSGLGWEDLLKKRRVIILGEPGSGKTWEFRERARAFQANGQFALFIPLDRLATEPWEAAIGLEMRQQVRRWLRNDSYGGLLRTGRGQSGPIASRIQS